MTDRNYPTTCLYQTTWPELFTDITSTMTANAHFYWYNCGQHYQCSQTASDNSGFKHVEMGKSLLVHSLKEVDVSKVFLTIPTEGHQWSHRDNRSHWNPFIYFSRRSRASSKNYSSKNQKTFMQQSLDGLSSDDSK
jgi:hypothetical protein